MLSISKSDHFTSKLCMECPSETKVAVASPALNSTSLLTCDIFYKSKMFLYVIESNEYSWTPPKQKLPKANSVPFPLPKPYHPRNHVWCLAPLNLCSSLLNKGEYISCFQDVNCLRVETQSYSKNIPPSILHNSCNTRKQYVYLNRIAGSTWIFPHYVMLVSVNELLRLLNTFSTAIPRYHFI